MVDRMEGLLRQVALYRHYLAEGDDSRRIRFYLERISQAELELSRFLHDPAPAMNGNSGHGAQTGVLPSGTLHVSRRG
jgi:hypothetical protein